MVSKFELITLSDMLKLYAKNFVLLMEKLEYLATINEQRSDKPVSDEDREKIKGLLLGMQEFCLHLGFAVSAALLRQGATRFGYKQNELSEGEAREYVRSLQRAIHAELQTATFLQLPVGSSPYYEDTPQFGEAVASKFPKAITDIQEAGKCFALGRYTASVFHLMRVMEHATQHLGKKLNIAFVAEKNWHNILDEVDKAIKALPATNSHQKGKRNRLAEASAHLRMVKDAWRNDVMHPKETYTDEEAERVFRNVKDFMVHLATKL